MEKTKVTIYKIKDGDSLSTIADQFNVNPTELLIKNQISPKHIFTGNILYIDKN